MKGFHPAVCDKRNWGSVKKQRGIFHDTKRERSFPPQPHPARTQDQHASLPRENPVKCVIWICNWNTAGERACARVFKSASNSAHGCDLGCARGREVRSEIPRTFIFDFIFRLPSGERDGVLMKGAWNPGAVPSAHWPGSGSPSPSPQHWVARCHLYFLNSRVISSPAGLPHMEPHFCSGFLICTQHGARLWVF